MGRRIRKNDATYSPRRLAFLHCLTEYRSDDKLPNKQRRFFRLAHLRFCHYSNGKACRESQEFVANPRDIWAAIQEKASKHHTLWLVMFNAKAQLSVTELWHLIDDGTIEFDYPGAPRQRPTDKQAEEWTRQKLFVIEAPPTIIGLRMPNGGRVVLVDTLNWTEQGIERLATWSSTDLSIQASELERCTQHLLKLSQSTLAIQRFFLGLMNWVRAEHLGQFRWTIASQAMSAFRHRFMKHDIVLWPDRDVRKLERDGYFGGTVELFRAGKVEEPIYQYDVNSLYPSVMLNNVYPASLKSGVIRKRWQDGKPDFYPAHSVARVFLETDKPVYPYRSKQGVIFPVGRFVTTLAGPELQEAFNARRVIAWESFVQYNCVPILHEYASYFLERRCQLRNGSDPLWEALTKLIANSLYGKWGQKSPTWEPRPNVSALHRWGRWSTVNLETLSSREYFAIAGRVFEKVEPTEHRNAFPAIAAFVTAYGRRAMQTFREIAGASSLIYQSCDSLAVDAVGATAFSYAGVLHQSKPGMLKLVHSAASGLFVGVNQYQIGDKLVRSGVKATATKNASGLLEQVESPGIRASLKAGPQRYVVETSRTLVPTSRYGKGTVLPDGRIAPLWIEENPDPDNEIAAAERYAKESARLGMVHPQDYKGIPF